MYVIRFWSFANELLQDVFVTAKCFLKTKHPATHPGVPEVILHRVKTSNPHDVYVMIQQNVRAPKNHPRET